MVYEYNYYLPININSHYSVSSKNEKNIIVSLQTIKNGDLHVRCYDSNDTVKYFLQTVPQNGFSRLYTLNLTIEEHEKLLDEKTQRAGIEFERLVFIGTNDFPYGYNYEVWDPIYLFILYIIFNGDYPVYVLFLFEFTEPETSTVVYVYKER